MQIEELQGQLSMSFCKICFVEGIKGQGKLSRFDLKYDNKVALKIVIH
jgi:hypothetical protein